MQVKHLRLRRNNVLKDSSVLQCGLFGSVSVENFWCIIKIGYIVSVRNKNIKLHKK